MIHIFLFIVFAIYTVHHMFSTTLGNERLAMLELVFEDIPADVTHLEEHAERFTAIHAERNCRSGRITCLYSVKQAVGKFKSILSDLRCIKRDVFESLSEFNGPREAIPETSPLGRWLDLIRAPAAMQLGHFIHSHGGLICANSMQFKYILSEEIRHFGAIIEDSRVYYAPP